MHFISVHLCVPADLTVRRTEAVSVNPRHHRHSRKSHSSALAVAAYWQSERECVSELRAGRGGASILHNNIGASETVEGRENAAEAGSRPSVADSGREGKRRILTSFFWIFPAPFCFPFFFTLQPFLSVSPCGLYFHCPTSRLTSISVYPALTHLWLPDSELLPLPSLFSFPALSFTSITFSLFPPSVWIPSLLLISPFLHLPVIHPFSVRCENASAGRALGPGSQDAGLRSGRRGRSRGLSRWGPPLAGLGSSQDASGDLRRGPVAGPGASSAHTTAQGSLEGSQGRPPGSWEKSGEHLGGSREGRYRCGEAWLRRQERSSGR